MSASISSKDKASESSKKPKRPLSGYNLFYRYKRNKVLEATANNNGSINNNCAAAASDDDAKIRTIITSLAGLENVSSTHPVWALPPHTLDELRASKIRRDMEGKLFPNENPRNRLHRKVHGMGFVEMGTLMREMWARADDFTKGVFGELADVGRVRYRRLLAEYKMMDNGIVGRKDLAEGKSGSAIAGIKSKETNKRNPLLHAPPEFEATVMENIAAVAPACAGVTTNPSEKVSRQKALISPVASTCSQVNMLATHALPLPRHSNSMRNSVAGNSIVSASHPGLPGALNSSVGTNLASLDGASFEPMPVATNFDPPKEALKCGRRVSSNSICGNNSLTSTPSSIQAPSSSAGSIFAYHQIHNEFQSLLMNSMPPPPLFIRSTAINNGLSNVESSHLDVIPAGSTMCNDQADMSPQANVSPQDFIELIGTLDDEDALGKVQQPSLIEEKRRPSMIFGKPIHDPMDDGDNVDKMMGGNTIPMPIGGYEINNSRARMA